MAKVLARAQQEAAKMGADAAIWCAAPLEIHFRSVEVRQQYGGSYISQGVHSEIITPDKITYNFKAVRVLR